MTTKIKDVFKYKDVTLSFEVFPPKNDMQIASITKAAQEIAALEPDFMSVTYGAGRGTCMPTIDIASKIQQMDTAAIAHLTCLYSTHDQVESVLAQLKQNGIHNILALRGDRTDASGISSGQYEYAYELIEHIKKHGDFCVGAACYPEGHVECASQSQDIEYLKQKVDSGCDFLTTQMFFDNSVFYSFMYRVLKKNISIPVVAGVMPVVNSKQITRICQLSGTSLPFRFRMIIDKFCDNPEAMKQAGIAYATEQIIDLIANGVKGIHIYTMNRPEIAQSIVANLSHILGR